MACNDPRPPPPSTEALKLAPRGVVTRSENFDGSIDGWQPVAGSWATRPGGSGQVLAQTATNQRFPVTLWKAGRYSDVDASVRFKPVSGAVDASGGIVFRARDGQNYYVVRANALEDNFRLYTVIDGTRRQIAGSHVEVPALGQWHSLRVVAIGPHVQAYLDDRLLIDHEDATFSEGFVGLWTKADAVTEFDDLVVHATPVGGEGNGASGAAAAAEAPSPAASEHEGEREPGAPGAAPLGFDAATLGELPGGWTAAVGDWRVEAASDGAGRVLAQRSKGRSSVFNLALLDEPEPADVEVRVRLRARGGRIDRGGGVAWRAADAKNYYVTRYNPLEDNFRVYVVQGGQRRQLGSADVRVDHDGWHEVVARMTGDRIQCFLDGEQRLEVRDATFSAAGRVGLWTKADAETEFDDLVVEPSSLPDGTPQ